MPRRPAASSGFSDLLQPGDLRLDDVELLEDPDLVRRLHHVVPHPEARRAHDRGAVGRGRANDDPNITAGRRCPNPFQQIKSRNRRKHQVEEDHVKGVPRILHQLERIVPVGRRHDTVVPLGFEDTQEHFPRSSFVFDNEDVHRGEGARLIS